MLTMCIFLLISRLNFGIDWIFCLRILVGHFTISCIVLAFFYGFFFQKQTLIDLIHTHIDLCSKYGYMQSEGDRFYLLSEMFSRMRFSFSSTSHVFFFNVSFSQLIFHELWMYFCALVAAFHRFNISSFRLSVFMFTPNTFSSNCLFDHFVSVCIISLPKLQFSDK